MKIHKKTVLYNLIIFFTVYLSGSVVSSIMTDSIIYKSVLYTCLMSLLYLTIKTLKNSKLYKMDLIVIMVIISFLIIEYVISPETIKLFFTRMVWYIGFYFSIRNAQKDNIDIFHILYKVITYIAFVTALFYVIVSLLKINVPHSIIITDTKVPWSLRYNNYFNIFFQNMRSNINIGRLTIPRLSGLFWEAGCYQIYLNYAIYRLLFWEKWNLKLFILLTLCLFFTFSTTGWSLFLIIVIFRLINSDRIRRNTRLLLSILVSILLVFLIYQVFSIKFKLMDTSMISYNDRVSDIQYGFQVFKNNPLLGTGFNNMEEFSNIQKNNRGNSNGIITILFSFGILGTFFIIYPFIKNISLNRRKDIFRKLLVFYLWFVIANATEPIMVTPIFWMILANESLKIREKNREVI